MVEKVNTNQDPPGLSGRAALVWQLLHTPECRGIIREIATERRVTVSAVSQGLRRGSPTYITLAAARIAARRQQRKAHEQALDAMLGPLQSDSS